jgi:hypothetical protein
MKKQKVSIRSSVNGVEYDVPFPLTYINANQWWTVSKGRGDYLGPSQMFGGPKTGQTINPRADSLGAGRFETAGVTIV